MEQQIIDLLLSFHRQCKGKMGLTAIDVSNHLNVPLEQLRPLLNILYSQGKIKIRQGINHKLIFPTKKCVTN